MQINNNLTGVKKNNLLSNNNNKVIIGIEQRKLNRSLLMAILTGCIVYNFVNFVKEKSSSNFSILTVKREINKP